MKGIVFYLIALLIIYLAEKEYRTRKLFLYPSFLLCPVFAVIAYAGVLVTKEATDSERKWKTVTKYSALLIYIGMIALGGSRSATEWFSEFLNNLTHMNAMLIASLIIALLSFAIYWLIAKKLCGAHRKNILLFLFLILLTYVFGYQSMAPEETILLFDCMSVTLLIRQLIVPGILLILLHKGTDRLLYEELTEEKSEPESNQKGESVMKKLINVRILTLAFIIYVLLSLFAIYTLNTKINNMSVYMQNMQESIDDLK